MLENFETLVRSPLWRCKLVRALIFFILIGCRKLHEVFVAIFSGFAPLVDGPYHQALATTAIARCKDTINGGMIISVFGVHIVALVFRNTETIDDGLLRRYEAHCKDD